VQTFRIHGKTQWLDHTADHLAVARVVELKVAPIEQLKLEADLDVDLNEVGLFTMGSVDGKVHAVWGKIALAPVCGVENFFDETNGALPGEGVECGVTSCAQRLTD
jgi:hypothetical protein